MMVLVQRSTWSLDLAKSCNSRWLSHFFNPHILRIHLELIMSIQYISQEEIVVHETAMQQMVKAERWMRKPIDDKNKTAIEDANRQDGGGEAAQKAKKTSLYIYSSFRGLLSFSRHRWQAAIKRPDGSSHQLLPSDD
jgi:hypothetical protein